jgi:hypothetical protein
VAVQHRFKMCDQPGELIVAANDLARFGTERVGKPRWRHRTVSGCDGWTESSRRKLAQARGHEAVPLVGWHDKSLGEPSGHHPGRSSFVMLDLLDRRR